MANFTVQPGTAPANPVTHAEAANFLQQYQMNSGSMAFARPAGALLNDIYGLTHLLSVAYDDANAVDDSEVQSVNPALLAGAFRAIRDLAALAAFFAEAL